MLTTISPRFITAMFHTPLRFSAGHFLLIFVATLDILITWWILALDGRELNPLAAAVIDRYALAGAVVFKFGLTALVILICEVIAARRDQTARRFLTAAVLISATAPAYGAGLLWWHARVLGLPLLP
jgi:hypothetical protein